MLQGVRFPKIRIFENAHLTALLRFGASFFHGGRGVSKKRFFYKDLKTVRLPLKPRQWRPTSV